MNVELPAQQKESFKALINHQWFIAWYGYCPMKHQFQMHSMYEGTLLQTELLSLSSRRDKTLCSGGSGCTLRTIVLCQRLTNEQASNAFELAVVLLFHSFAILRRHWIYWTTFESLGLHLLMSFIFWWFPASDELASDDVITSGALCLQEHFDFRSNSLHMLLSFLFVYLFALFCSSRTYKWSQKFCLWSCTLEQILAYPIDNFLIPYYHQNL